MIPFQQIATEFNPVGASALRGNCRFHGIDTNLKFHMNRAPFFKSLAPWANNTCTPEGLGGQESRGRLRRRDQLRQHCLLERVLQRELQVALGRTWTLERDIAEVTIGDAAVRIAVAHDVQCVECIESEADRVLTQCGSP